MKKRNIIILVAVFVLLLGCYIYMKVKPAGEDKADSEQKIELAVFDSKKIKKMVIESHDGSMELDRNGESWKLKSNPEISLDQSSVDDIATSFANLYAEKVLDENPEELGQYGLDSGKVTATATLDDGSEKTIYVGDEVPGGSSYYMMVKDDPKLYLIASADGRHFRYTVADIRNKTIFSAGTDTVNYIKVKLSDGRTVEMKKVESGSAEEKEYPKDSWILLKPYSQTYSMDESGINDMINNLADLKINGFVNDNPDSYSEYGLDKPSLDVTANAGGNTIHLLFGKKSDDSDIYVMVDGSKPVYKISSWVYDSFNKEPFDLVNKTPGMVNIDDVDRIVIEENGREYTAELKREKKPAEKEGEEEQVITTYSINGKDIKEEEFKSFYEKLIALKAEAENDRTIQGQPDVKVTFTLNEGEKKQIIISYCPYNDDFYGMFVNGKADFLISKEQVRKMLEELHKLI